MARPSAYRLYLGSVTLLGLGLVAAGLWRIPAYDPLLHFLLLLLLASLAEASAVSMRVSEQAGITFGVGTAIAMSALPVFGPLAGTVVVATINVGLWLIKPQDRTLWKRNLTQLGFNTGMHSIAILGAGLAWDGVTALWGMASLPALIAAWLAAAIVNDQLNFWLVMGVLRLQHGSGFKILQAWRENLWAVPVNIAVLSAGGALLAFAAERYDTTGILIFFVPIVLSAYAYRLYIRQMQDHMRNLEEIVTQRTTALAEQAERLTQLNQQKDTYIAVLSHDIKTALTSISVYTSLMRDYPQIVAEEPQVTEDISHSLDLVTNIVSDIVDLEKLENGFAAPSRPQTFQLDRVLPAVAESLRIQARKKEITLNVEAAALSIPLYADRSQIERVLLNLISNGIRYTPRGGQITAGLAVEGDQAVCRVSDTGYGIPAADLPTIFDRYSRVGSSLMRDAGTGLGLAISKAFVEAHGGTIAVDSVEGQGSTFTVRLPLAPARPPFLDQVRPAAVAVSQQQRGIAA